MENLLICKCNQKIGFGTWYLALQMSKDFTEQEVRITDVTTGETLDVVQFSSRLLAEVENARS